MYPITLNEFPPPPLGKSGWPWTVESSQFPEGMPDGSPWPWVTIVTPSYNQGQFLEETIRSVLLQGYPNLEYIIMDGGSTDESVEIIRNYEPWLAHWVSEPDGGQVFAIDKGWRKSGGDILAYLNSDDTYLAGAIASAVRHLQRHPEAAAVCGGELVIDRDGWVLSTRLPESATFHDLMQFRFIPQPAVFLRRSALEAAGGLDTAFPLVLDFELWTRLVQQGEMCCVPEVFATTRWYPETKTLSQRPKVIAGLERVMEKVLASPAGDQLTPADLRLTRARLGYTATDVYMDSVGTHGWALLSSMFAVIKNWPRLVPDLMRLVAGKALPGSVWRFLRSCKRVVTGAAPVGRGTQPRIHWSAWQPGFPFSEPGSGES